VWAQYTVKVPPGARDDVIASCKAAGVPVAVHYTTPLHRLPAYRQFPAAATQLKRVEALSREVLSLPMHADLDERTQDYVIDTMRRAIASHAPKPLHAHA
jgi:dTDP-4-amino-4,6-dideoxygalactose transaminase